MAMLPVAAEQQARDIAAQTSGYKPEDDMVAQLDSPSEIIATEVTQKGFDESGATWKA